MEIVEEEGWWKGRVDGRKGVLPSNFVEAIEQSGSTTFSDPAHDYSVRQNINARFCSWAVVYKYYGIYMYSWCVNGRGSKQNEMIFPKKLS